MLQMFESMCTEMDIRGVVLVTSIQPMQTVRDNKFITLTGQTTRRRITYDTEGKKKLVFDHDTISLSFWASGAEFIAKEVAEGDLLFVRGDIRGKAGSNIFRVKSFEILTPDSELISAMTGDYTAATDTSES